jgi:hypothetical protein
VVTEALADQKAEKEKEKKEEAEEASEALEVHSEEEAEEKVLLLKKVQVQNDLTTLSPEEIEIPFNKTT